MQEQSTDRVEVFRAVLPDYGDPAGSDYWRPSRALAEQDAQECTENDAECRYVQVGWVRAADVPGFNEWGFLVIGEDLVEEGGLVPVDGWLDDEDRDVLDALWDLGLDPSRIETVREALIRDAVKRTAP